MRQIRFMVAPYALQDVLRALYSQENKEIRNEIYVTKEDNDLVVVVTEHDKSKKEYSEGVKPSGIAPSSISPSTAPHWVDDPITRYL